MASSRAGARFYDVELPSPDYVRVGRFTEAAVVGEILTDRRFLVEVADLDGARDRAAVERFGL